MYLEVYAASRFYACRIIGGHYNVPWVRMKRILISSSIGLDGEVPLCTLDTRDLFHAYNSQ